MLRGRSTTSIDGFHIFAADEVWHEDGHAALKATYDLAANWLRCTCGAYITGELVNQIVADELTP